MVDDEDEFDEEAIPGFSHPSMNASPASATLDKGKGRAEEKVIPTTKFSIGDSDDEDGKHVGAIVTVPEGEEEGLQDLASPTDL